jgi:hypothetical protein
VPATGALRYQGFDGCYLDNGNTKASSIAAYDDPANTLKPSGQFRVAYSDANIAISSQSSSTNADGSTRTLVEVTYDRLYADGTSEVGSRVTFVTGSTFGACATPTADTTLRVFGNRRLAQFQLRPRNIRQRNAVLATGLENTTTPEQTRREIQFRLSDPGNIATYAILTGPGPAGPSGQPFSLKLLSPRVSRDAPEMAGKPGNANYANTDAFRMCNSGVAGVPTADIANCVTNGVGGDNWGVNMLSSIFDGPTQVAADTSFANQGWSIAAGAYTVNFYNDDGWKTVNGQVGKTPVATYTTTLSRLPYTFNAMFSLTSPGYAEFDYDPAVYASGAAAILGAVNMLKGPGGALPVTGLSCLTPASAAKMAINSMYGFNQGPNQTTSSWPRTRQNNVIFPLSSATTATVQLPGLTAPMTSVNFGEIGLECTDRRGGWIIQRFSAQ